MADIRYGRFASDDINDFYLEASRGRIDGVSVVHKFGLASNIDTADGIVDVWDGVHENMVSKINPYNWIEGGPVDLQISSSSALDVGNEVTGQGLDENWDLAIGSVILNGQNAVAIGLQRNRIFRAYISGPTETQGIVYVSDLGTALVGGVPTDLTKVRAIIHPDSQQTQMALYTVPAGHEMYVTHGWANIARGGGASVMADCRIFRRSFGGVFRAVHTFSLGSQGASGDHRPYTLPIKFNEKEDLIYRVNSVTANDTAVSAGFHALIIKK